MGGRDNGDDTVAITDFDHNDANNLGSAILTTPDPLAGLDKLAAQVLGSGIKKVSGNIIIDDRLFQPFRVPNQHLLITPIVINDNRIDVTILPTEPGKRARVEWRPHTAAFKVIGDVITVAPGSKTAVRLIRCGPREGIVTGQIAVDFIPPLPGVKTLVQTFRIDDPSAPQDPASFARTTFIEALKRAGVTVTVGLLCPNPSDKLPPPGSYCDNTKVAELVSAPYAQYSKLILKVSHNLGANLSLMLFGLANGVDTIENALSVERATLIDRYELPGHGFDFPTNGSGSPAQGKVFAKTGTFLEDGNIKAQVLAGYIHTRSGRHLAFALYVNDAGEITDIADVIDVIQDEGAISTIIQQLN